MAVGRSMPVFRKQVSSSRFPSRGLLLLYSVISLVNCRNDRGSLPQIQATVTTLCTLQTINGAKAAVDAPGTSGSHAERTVDSGKPSFPSLHAR